MLGDGGPDDSSPLIGTRARARRDRPRPFVALLVGGIALAGAGLASALTAIVSGALQLGGASVDTASPGSEGVLDLPADLQAAIEAAQAPFAPWLVLKAGLAAIGSWYVLRAETRALFVERVSSF